jgi:Fe-S cluster biogenesis protein NfuA
VESSSQSSSQGALAPAVNRDALVRICREVLAPLIEADGGEMYLVSLAGEDIHIHLAGTCAGCPGSAFTAQSVIGPAIAKIAPKAKLRLTTGWRVPPEAERLEGKR